MKRGFKFIIRNILHVHRNESEISNTRADNRLLHLPVIQCLMKIRYKIQISTKENSMLSLTNAENFIEFHNQMSS